LFLLGVALDLAVTGDLTFFHSMRGDVQRVLDWMDNDADRDGDGFYEYETRAGKGGLKNQGWKDSGDAILHADGSMVENPIAVCEVQALYYAAKLAIAHAFAHDGDHAVAAKLLEQAARLKRQFNERFWMSEDRYFALALGPEKRQVRSIASNPGSCLAYGIIDDDKAGSVIERLMAPDMFSGWGIRTLSAAHPAYNPFSYHLGSVWPFANANTAFGLKRYGAIDACHRVAEAMFEATQLFAHDRLPEVFGGNPRDDVHPHPGLYPGGCAPQAWSASAIISFVSTLLGIVPLAPLNTLIIAPTLPAWLPDIALENIRVGDARISLRFHRESTGHTQCEVTARTGNVRLHRPPAEDQSGVCDRLPWMFRQALA
jgi:glycogen debranching enzyme